MSFYGNVLYTVADAFASLFVKNNGKYNTTFIAPDDEASAEIAAAGLGGYFTLNSGNKWIHLKGDPNQHSCLFYHAPADNTDYSHNFSAMEPNNYSQPEEGPFELSPGGIIHSTKVYYDQAGHITSIEPQEYKLPISEGEQVVIEVKEDIENLKLADETHTGDINNLQINYTSMSGDVTNALSQVTALNNSVGNVNSMGLGEKRSLTRIIGSTDELNSTFGATSNKPITVIDAMSNLKASTTALENKIGDVSGSNRDIIRNLCTALENNYNISINPETLWDTID